MIRDPRLVIFGAADRALRLRAAEETVAGRPVSDETFDGTAAPIAQAVEDPLSDVHASEEYRRHLAVVLGAKVLRVAASRAGGGE